MVLSGLVSGALAGAASSNATCSPSWIISGLAELEQFYLLPLRAETEPGKAVEMYTIVHTW